MPSTLFHITTRPDAEAAADTGEYVPQAFSNEGFIHCSWRHQVAEVANRLFRGRTDLVLLEIERTRVPHEVIEENLEGGAELYPHVYGPLPMSAVVAVHDFVPNGDGRFGTLIPDPFYRDPRIYDAITGARTSDTAFYVAHAVDSGGPVLEIACGTGRITIPIAQAGIELTGLDVSPAMLGEAREKAHRGGVEVEWVEADCREFELEKQFAMIFFPFNSLLHLHDRVSFERFLARVRAHLAPEGRFLFDVFNPGLEFIVENSRRKRQEATFVDPYSGLTGVIEETLSYDAVHQINRTTWFCSVGDQKNVAVADLHLRCLYPQELEALLHYNGFEIVEKLGNFDGTPFSAESSMQIVTCRVRDRVSRETPERSPENRPDLPRSGSARGPAS